MPTESWETWRDRHFGDPNTVWHDGPDFAALGTAAHADPDAVWDMLRLGLRERDPLAAQAMVELAEASMAPPDAQMIMEAQAEASSGDFRIRLGQALHTVTKDESWSDLIQSVLTNPREHWGIRLNAAMALADFPPTEAILTALHDGVLDPEYLVRHHSAEGLLKAAGRSPDINLYPHLLELIVAARDGTPTEADRRAWKGAATLLVIMVRARLG